MRFFSPRFDTSFLKISVFLFASIYIIALIHMADAIYGLTAIGLLGAYLLYWLSKKIELPQKWWYRFVTLVSVGSVFWIQGAALTLKGIELLLLFLLYYSGVKYVLKDSMVTILLLIVLLLSASFSSSVAYTIPFLGLLITVLFIARFRRVKRFILQEYNAIKSKITLLDFHVWILLLLLVVCYGIKTKEGFFAADYIHPPYELSIGHSLENKAVDFPDFSYAGKTIKYHFLTTRIPIFIANVFNTSFLDSAYFLVNLLMMLIFFLLFYAFFGVFRHLQIPLFYFVFFPIKESESFFSRSILLTPSYFFGAMLLFLAVCFILQKRWIWFLFSSSCLVLVKASNFLPLFVGTFIYFVFSKKFKEIFYYLVPLGGIFLFLYSLYLKGAHQHELWFIYPAYSFDLYQYMKGSPLDAAFWIMLLGFLVFCSLKAIWSSGSNQLQLVGAIALAGFLWSLFLTESSSGSSILFFVAVAPFFAILTWYFVKRYLSIVPIRFLPALRDCVIVFLLITSIGKLGMFGGNFIAAKTGFLQQVYIKDDLINAYSWIGQNIGKEEVVLFGKQYDWMKIYFWRSPLSGRQMYFENYKYKGIVMQSDAPERLANVIHFYKNFVDLSDESQGAISVFYKENFGNETGCEEGLPLSQSKYFVRRLTHVLSGGREWFWKNRKVFVEQKCHKLLNTLPNTKKWARSFLKQANIGYVVLEKNDKPKDFLKKYANVVFSKNGITVLKVNKEML